MPTDFVSPKQAATLLGLHVSTIYRYVGSGALRAYRVAGSRYRLSRADVLGLLVEVTPAEPVTTRKEDEEAAAAAVERMRRDGHRV